MAQDEPKKALRHLQAAEKAHPDAVNSDALFLKGQVHEAMHEPRQAVEAYRKALDEEDAPDVLQALIRLTSAQGSKAEANGYWRRFAVAVGDQPEGLAQAADLAARLGRFDDAYDLASQARIGKTELHPLALRPMGLALYHRGKFGEAANYLAKAEPDAEGLTGLVQSLIALGRLGDAETQLSRFASIEPTPESRKVVAWVKSLGTRRTALNPAVTPASADTDTQPTAVERAVCADALHSRGLWPERVDRLLDEAISGKTPVGSALGLRALIRIQRGQLTAALRDAELAISLSPNDARGYHARGRVRCERAQDGGIQDLERAAQISEHGDAKILSDLASAYFTAGKKMEALAAQREAARLKPDDAEIRDQLREFEAAR
jgi:tetratricopeptide (TPR) repeat protein